MATFRSIADASIQLSEGRVSARQICSDMLEAAQSSPVDAYSYLLRETALAEAEASDQRRKSGNKLGPLDGIPIAVKDIIDTSPAVCMAGLLHLAGYRPGTDAPVVRRLREAGAVILGVTETDPGAFSTETPQVTNPLAPERIAGGSSGGSAAAVAAGLAVGAIGTDTGGSIRIPAACCSIYGFKPTWGRVDTTGVRPLARTLDHVGPMARCVADLRILQTVLDPTLTSQGRRNFRRLRLGICEAYFSDATPAIKETLLDVIGKVSASGGSIIPVDLPPPDEVMKFHMINLPREAAEYHGLAFPSEWTHYPEIARSTIMMGNSISVADHEKAERERQACRLTIDHALENVDALILPTMPMDAPMRGAQSINLGELCLSSLQATIRYTAIFNQTGHPVVSMPAGLLPDGRALSVQLVGKRGGDDSLLLMAEDLEEMISITVDYAGIIEGRNRRNPSLSTANG